MNPRTKVVEDLFQRAAELPVDAHPGFLDQHCTDAGVRTEVERLLALDESGAAEEAEAGLMSSLQLELTDPALERIGQYTIVRRIGTGGMGAVFEATQEHPRRTVALKLVRRDLLSRDVLLRFRYEVDILGQLHHPGIAQIYEAGVAELPDDGLPGAGETVERPFFAMELVRGEPLTEYAQRRRMDIRARLDLMAKLCDAVQHAHQKGVIHRDLKPANILVTKDGQPKILDFGIARATDSAQRAGSLHTATGQLIGTLPYMSPEQVSEVPEGLDTRSDVYALGVMLYELLSGDLPHDLRARSIPEAALVIRDVEPRRLSSFDTSFRGDIETIVAKALEKARERRYTSAAELAADLRRYLGGEPIQARPATTLYQLRKFTTRHPALVGGLLATILVLVGGIIATSQQAYRASRAEAEAKELAASERVEKEAALQAANLAAQSRRRADDISSFLLWGFGSGEVDRPPDGTLTIGEMLELVSERVGEYFAGRPEQEATARRVIGDSFFMNNMPERAIPQLARACDILRELPGHERELHVSLIMLNMAEREAQHGEAAASRWMVEATHVAERVLGERYPELSGAVNEMMAALLVPDRPDDEEVSARLDEVLRALPDAMPADHPDAGYAGSILATVGSYLANSFDVSLPVFRMLEEALAIRRRLTPADLRECTYFERHVLLISLWMVTRCEAPEGEEELRVARGRELLDLAEWFGAVSLFRDDVAGVLGEALLQRNGAGDVEEAERLILESHEQLDRSYGATHIRALIGLTRVVDMYRRLDRPDDLLRASVAALPALSSGPAAEDAQLRAILAGILDQLCGIVVSRPGLDAGTYELALRGAERSVQLDSNWSSLGTSGAALLRGGQPARALEVLRRSVASAAEAGAPDPPTAWACIVMAHEALGQPAEADSALAHLQAIPSVVDGTLDADARSLTREAEQAVGRR